MLPTKVISWSILILIVLSLVSFVIGIKHPILILNENQIFYLYSTSAQVLSGIYGLTLTGFIFFRNELSREEFNDDSLVEPIESLKKRYSFLLIFVTFLTIFTLLSCNLMISMTGGVRTIFKAVIINVTQSSFVVNLFVIAYFIFDVISPKRIEKASLELQREFDPIDEDVERGSLEAFLKNFNEIEGLLQKYGQTFQNKMVPYLSKHERRIPNPKLAQIIFQAERIDESLYNEIRNLITLRNSIVHGAKPIVSLNVENMSRNIMEKLRGSLTVSSE